MAIETFLGKKFCTVGKLSASSNEGVLATDAAVLSYDQSMESR